MRADSLLPIPNQLLKSLTSLGLVVGLFAAFGQAQSLSSASLDSTKSPQAVADSIKTSPVITETDTVSTPVAPIVADSVKAPIGIDTVKSPTATAEADSVVPVQSVPEEVIETQGPDDLVIEVDQRQTQNAHKSLPLALLYSAVLPGSGEYYLRDQGRAKTFLLAEAGFWAALYIAFISQDSYLQSARNSASEYAGIDAADKNESFLNTMASFRSYQEKQHRQDSYELAQILSGKRDRDYDIPMKAENDWDFGSSSNPQNTRNWKTFQSTLRYYRASKVAMSFAIGALALNRLASLANTLHVYKRTSAKGIGLQLIPEIGPEQSGARLSLGF